MVEELLSGAGRLFLHQIPAQKEHLLEEKRVPFNSAFCVRNSFLGWFVVVSAVQHLSCVGQGPVSDVWGWFFGCFLGLLCLLLSTSHQVPKV